MLSVEDVEHAELLDGLLAEFVEGDVDDFFAGALGQFFPGDAGGLFAEQGDVFFPTVMGSGDD